MLFVGGPRQVGKTTLAKAVGHQAYPHCLYLNWDRLRDQKQILDAIWPGQTDLIILDEIHKYRKWKTWLKGEYDTYRDTLRFLITGSSRLDVYRKGGDSLQGRYFYYRLHPFSLKEWAIAVNGATDSSLALPYTSLVFGKPEPEGLVHLLSFGGFPEPLFKGTDRFAKRWRNHRLERLFREDIRDLEPIRELSSMMQLSHLLPTRAGALFSANSVREDLQVSHATISHWMTVLESFYYLFRLYPYHPKTIRSLKKEPKLYLFDWAEIPDPGARFENLVASHLLKFVHYLYDVQGIVAGLHFLRDVDQREVDFLVTIDNRPWFAVEAKMADTTPSRALSYFKKKLDIPFTYQVVAKDNIDLISPECRVLSASRFLTGLI